MWNVDSSRKKYLHLWLKSQLVVTIMDNESQSQPCLNIYYTSDDTIEQSSCCGLDVQTQTLTILLLFYCQISGPWCQSYPWAWLKSQLVHFPHHLSISWWEYETSKLLLLWFGCTDPHSQSWSDKLGPSQNFLHLLLKSLLVVTLVGIEFQFQTISPFINHMMRLYKSQAAVFWVYRPNQTIS